MSTTTSGVARHFTVTQRLIHWLMAVAILAMLFIGVGMVSTVMPDYLSLVSIHRPLGIAILLLVLLRIVVRLIAGSPGLPRDLPEPMKLAARLSHLALYALMVAMPLLGCDPAPCGGRFVPRLGAAGRRVPGDDGRTDA